MFQVWLCDVDCDMCVCVSGVVVRCGEDDAVDTEGSVEELPPGP